MNETLTALIEAAKQADREVGMYGYVMQNTQEGIVTELRNSQLPLRASLARDAALEAFVKEVEHEVDILIADKYGISSNPERHAALIWCHDRLTQILEGGE